MIFKILYLKKKNRIFTKASDGRGIVTTALRVSESFSGHKVLVPFTRIIAGLLSISTTISLTTEFGLTLSFVALFKTRKEKKRRIININQNTSRNEKKKQ